ncbi:hypothetical protein KI387_011259, partial [Taxus chinensis]
LFGTNSFDSPDSASSRPHSPNVPNCLVRKFFFSADLGGSCPSRLLVPNVPEQLVDFFLLQMNWLPRPMLPDGLD